MENSKTIRVSFKGKTAELQQQPNGKWVCTNLGEFTKLGSSITWLDDCRVPAADAIPAVPQAKGGKGDIYGFKNGEGRNGEFYDNTRGRFPANLIVSDDVLNDGRVIPASFRKGDRGFRIGLPGEGRNKDGATNAGFTDTGSYSRYFSLDNWWAKTLPFLIVPKASKSEKNGGLETEEKDSMKWAGGNKMQGLAGKYPDGTPRPPQTSKNFHPTVKPLKLMSYLITLGSRPGDKVLDPFTGSGTTLCAAKALGRKYIGIELQKEYVHIAKARITATEEPAPSLFAAE